MESKVDEIESKDMKIKGTECNLCHSLFDLEDLTQIKMFYFCHDCMQKLDRTHCSGPNCSNKITSVIINNISLWGGSIKLWKFSIFLNIPEMVKTRYHRVEIPTS